MVERPAPPPQAPRDGPPSTHKEFSLLPGLAFTGLGSLFIAPFLYQSDAFGSSLGAAGRLLALSVGIAFVLIGLAALARAIGSPRRAPGQTHFLARLERLFFGMGHLAVIVTLIGMGGLVLFDMRGGFSGVPVAMGMLIAGFMYTCGGVCRAIR